MGILGYWDTRILLHYIQVKHQHTTRYMFGPSPTQLRVVGVESRKVELEVASEVESESRGKTIDAH
jgi:hypothetical protein